MHAVFIRAPVVESVGPDATPLATLADGRVVAVEQGGPPRHRASTPRSTDDYRFHEYFLSKLRDRD